MIRASHGYKFSITTQGLKEALIVDFTLCGSVNSKVEWSLEGQIIAPGTSKTYTIKVR